MSEFKEIKSEFSQAYQNLVKIINILKQNNEINNISYIAINARSMDTIINEELNALLSLEKAIITLDIRKLPQASESLKLRNSLEFEIRITSNVTTYYEFIVCSQTTKLVLVYDPESQVFRIIIKSKDKFQLAIGYSKEKVQKSLVDIAEFFEFIEGVIEYPITWTNQEKKSLIKQRVLFLKRKK